MLIGWTIVTTCYSLFMILEYLLGIDNFWTIFIFHFGQRENTKILDLHIIGTLLVCIFGTLQLANFKYQTRLQKYHPYTGSIYMVGVFCISCSWALFVILNDPEENYYVSIPCGIYPCLLIIYSLITIYCAAKQYPSHKYWAIRLYMLAMAPVIYRMFYYFMGISDSSIFYWLFFIIPVIYAEIYLIVTYRTKHLRCKSDVEDMSIYKNLVSGELIHPS